MSEALFSYCLMVARREFLIEVTHDGFIFWDDYQERRRSRNPQDRHLEIQALLGSRRARRRISAEVDEFTVSFQLSPELLIRFRDAARLLAAGRWTTEHEEELDTYMIGVFWSAVNPHLMTPIVSPPSL
jgi:hypothetical protein